MHVFSQPLIFIFPTASTALFSQGLQNIYTFNPTAYIFWFMLHNEEDLASIKTLYKITAKSVLWLFLGKTYEVLKLSQLWAGTAGSGGWET